MKNLVIFVIYLFLSSIVWAQTMRVDNSCVTNCEITHCKTPEMVYKGSAYQDCKSTCQANCNMKISNQQLSNEARRVCKTTCVIKKCPTMSGGYYNCGKECSTACTPN